jgi:hypothetical protein
MDVPGERGIEGEQVAAVDAVASPVSSMRLTKPARLAKNTSPWPVTRINGLSSEVTIFFSSLPMLPAFSWWNSIEPWKATIAPFVARTSGPRETRSIWLFCRANRCCWSAISRLDWSKRALCMTTP